MKFRFILFALFFSSIGLAQTKVDSTTTQEEDFSMYADVVEVPSANKSKIYCSQKILGLSPSKLISFGYDFVGANSIDMDTIGSFSGNTANIK